MSPDEFSAKLADYRLGRADLADLQDWFELRSTAAAYDDPALREAFFILDSLLSSYHFDDQDEPALRNAIPAVEALLPTRIP